MQCVDTLFARAIAIESPDERNRFFEEACGGDTALRRELEQLVADHFRAGAFLEQPAAQLLFAVDPSGVRETAGTVIGPYKLLEQIGEGGMGLVFVAEQQHPLRRRVAVKLIKPGMDTREVIARFEAERQALALMDHPNVCRVLDAGETASGLPFFVMELVRGMPLTDYCDRNELNCRERLALFATACQAVQHAHTKGIIHRDIKPSNILVTLHDGIPAVKVIDFGVARAIGQRLTEKTVYTRFMQMIGTPLYMSPEQAEMSALDIDTRSDIYSLGVLLFELLTGVTPFDRERMTRATFEEVRRILREEDPPAPSARVATLGRMVTTVSVQRGSDPRHLRLLLRGELDWMVMKALEKDRGRRYETASAFAADVEHYLRDERVAAGPPSAVYRFGKFARRNRRLLVTASVIGLSALLAAASVAGSIGWAMRDRSLRQATLEGEVARALEETKSAYQRDQLGDAQAALKRAQGLLAGQAASPLSQRVQRWRANLEMVARLDEIRMIRSESKDRIAIQRGYEQAFRSLGIDAPNMPPAEAAQRVRESEIRAHLVIALDDWIATKLQWEPAGREQLAAVVRMADPGSWRNRIRDPAAWYDRDKLEQIAAEPESVQLPPSTAVLLSRALGRLGSHSLQGAVLRAVQLRHPADFWLNRELAGHCAVCGRRDDATSFYRAALAARPDDPIAHADLAQYLSKIGRHAEAIELLHRALELRPEYVWGHTLLAGELWRTGCWDEAFAGFDRALALKPDDYLAVTNLACAHRNKGNLDQAVALCRRALSIDPRLPMAYQELGCALEQKGELVEAETAYREVCRRVPKTPAYHCDLARFLGRRQAYDEAIDEYGIALACDPACRDAGVELAKLAASLFKAEDSSRAIRCCRVLLRANPQSVGALRLLADALVVQAELTEAIGPYQAALKIAPADGDTLDKLFQLANRLRDGGDRTAALRCYRLVLDADSGHGPAQQALMDFGD